MKFADEYMYFLNKGKTERECVAFAKKMLDENGFKCICEYETLKPGDKVYYINKDRSLFAAVIGKQDGYRRKKRITEPNRNDWNLL